MLNLIRQPVIGHFCVGNALQSSGLDREKLEFIIAAHNFGDIYPGTYRSRYVPCHRQPRKTGPWN